MLRLFIRIPSKLPAIFILTIITILSVLRLFSDSVSIQLLKREHSSLRINRCVVYARKLTHNLTATNGWQTTLYLRLSGRPTNNITQYWNEDDRFHKFDFTGVKNCSIIYCGANTDGTDGLRFAKEYPSCRIWFLEPMPSFYEQFVHSSGWKLLMKSKTSDLYNAYSYGLSNRSAFIDIAENSSSEGQSFSLIREQQVISSYQRHKIIVRDVSELLFELKVLRQFGTNWNSVNGELTLLHMNCEGCEYEVLERLIDTNLIKHVRYLQFGTHRPLAIQSTIAERYCSLQEKLINSHSMQFGIPWGWERWVLQW